MTAKKVGKAKKRPQKKQPAKTTQASKAQQAIYWQGEHSGSPKPPPR